MKGDEYWIMLDNLDEISKIDKSDMIGTIEQFPNHVEEAIHLINETDIKNIYKIDNIIISGVGGSAVSGDIIQSFFRDKIDK